jgi:uncharacterized protein (DUF952 family)
LAIIFHITNPDDWYKAKVKGEYDSTSLHTEGFIHCSTKDQFIRSANKHFKGESGIILLQIEVDKVKNKIKFENLSGGKEDFPHIYGPINIEAVTDVFELKANGHGEFLSPL